MKHQKSCLLSNLFHKNPAQNPLPTIPQWEEIVSMMFDKGLDSFCDEIAEVIYNREQTKRFVILKSANGYYKYAYEELYAFDEEEWMYIGRQPDALPAMWMEPNCWQGTSFYFNYDDTLKEIRVTPEYQTYFSDI